jgi:hypothetical protein
LCKVDLVNCTMHAFESGKYVPLNLSGGEVQF